MDKKRNINYKPTKIDFNALSGEEFENMCYWLIDDMPEFKSVHQIGVENTKAVDISAKKDKKLYYIQVKRYKSLNNTDIKKILNLLKEKISEDKIIPYCFMIMTSCEVGEKKRVYAKEEAKNLGLKNIRIDVWDGNKLEKLLYKHKKILNHFYKDGSVVKVKHSSLSTFFGILSVLIVFAVFLVIIGNVYPSIPVISDFSRISLRLLGQETGYIQGFAEDLDELIIIRRITNEIENLDIPDSIRENLINAQNMILENRSYESISILEDILKNNNDIIPAYFLLGTAKFINNHRRSEIKNIYGKSIDNEKSFWQAYNNAGVLSYNLGDINEALNLFEKALDINEESPEIYRNLAIAYNRLGYSSKAYESILMAERVSNNIDRSSGVIIAKRDTTKTDDLVEKEDNFKNIDENYLMTSISRESRDIRDKVDLDTQKIIRESLERRTIGTDRLDTIRDNISPHINRDSIFNRESGRP